jgi:hypothetical protein
MAKHPYSTPAREQHPVTIVQKIPTKTVPAKRKGK